MHLDIYPYKLTRHGLWLMFMAAVVEVGVGVAGVEGSRSQLGKNNGVLLVLCQVFGGSRFTSREAADRLGLDFLYTAKALFRMRRNNLLRVAARESRLWGGFENVYEISVRGFSKVSYILAKQGTPARACPEPEPDLVHQACASQYVLHGRGYVGEFFGHAAFRIVTHGVHVPTVSDEVDMLLTCLSPTFLGSEFLRKYVSSGSRFDPSYWKLVARAAHLQGLGFVPKDIDLPFFVGNEDMEEY